MKILTGTQEVFSHYQSGYMWTGDGNRPITYPVRFSEKFKATPVVMVAISGFDGSNQKNLRLRVAAHNPSPEHFDIVVTTWADTKLAMVEVSWIAIDPRLLALAEGED